MLSIAPGIYDFEEESCFQLNLKSIDEDSSRSLQPRN